ncbi:conserved hypothetical protein [Pyrobaculum aerophilum str. IM2]|uniref:Uncharacterized protein n=2 Tax=Pyrobaculum aerophilum TaxID=13773 RepID=Q8ZTA0_PYRAE|nr:COG1361 S-layer family protein [Pyrobaculum aerophilum]AAL64863.1 conserved hypothetical protein [Pyrobaculum aerophilum str. IM2]HII47526.1 S-layer protein [Pyrobaculum aerophilum]
MQSIYRIMWAITLAAFLSAQALAPTAQQQFNVALSYSPPYVYPGSIVQLYITIISAQSMSNVYVDINSPFKVLTGSTVQIQQISGGVPATVVAVVQVPLDARPGYYTIKVTAYTLMRAAESSIDIEVLPFDFSALVVPRITAYLPGQPVQLPVFLINPTADYLKARVSINGSAVLQYLNSSLSCDAVIPPRSNSTCFLSFMLPGWLKPGFYNATLSVSFSSLSGYAGSVTFVKSIQLPVISGVDVNIMASPTQPVVIGSPTLISIVIYQGSAAPLQNVTIRVLNGDGVRILGNSVFTIPLLTQIQLPVQLIITKYGGIKIPVEICHYSICTVKYAELFIPSPGVTVNAVFNPPQGYPGSVVQSTFIIATNYTMSNVGVEIRAPFKALTSPSILLPLLAPQSPATINVVFEIPKEVRPGIYPINITVAGAMYTFYYEVLKPEFNVVVTFNPPVAYPGAVVSGNLVVTSPFNAKDLDILLSTPMSLLSPTGYRLPYLPQGQPYAAYVVLQVPEETPPGKYPLTVSVNGVNYTFYVNVGAPNVVIQNVIVTPPRELEGTPMAQVALQVLNTGPVVARNVTIVLLNSTIGRQSYVLDYLPPGSPVTLTYYVNTSKLPPGRYNVVAMASWNGGVYLANGPLDVAKKDVFKITHKVYNVAPGSTAVLVINITNLGPDEAKNLRVSFTPSQVFELHASNIADVATASVRVLGDLAPGASVSTAFLLDVSDKTVPGVYTITLVATWNQTGVFMPGVQYINIPIEVRSGVDMFIVIPLVLTALLIITGIVIALRRKRRG